MKKQTKIFSISFVALWCGGVFSPLFAASENESCVDEVKSFAVETLAPKNVKEIEETNITLRPGEDAPLYQGEVWNSKDNKHNVDVYLVKSTYMAKFWYGFMVNPEDCNVENYTEVYFE